MRNLPWISACRSERQQNIAGACVQIDHLRRAIVFVASAKHGLNAIASHRNAAKSKAILRALCRNAILAA